MLILAIETATTVGSVALVSERKIIASRYFDTGSYHSQRLFIEATAIFDSVGYPFKQIDAVAVSIGPGSFTGLRIGLSAAKGFCLAVDGALLTIPTLEALAARVPYARAPVCPVLDARRGQVFTALFETADGRPEQLTEVHVANIKDLLNEREGTDTIYLGDVELLTEVAERTGAPTGLSAPFPCVRPDAGTVGWLAVDRFQSKDVADLANAEPEYIRPPYVDEGKTASGAA